MLRISDIKKVLNEFLEYTNDPKFIEYLNSEDIIEVVEDFCAGISTEIITFKLKEKRERDEYKDNS